MCVYPGLAFPGSSSWKAGGRWPAWGRVPARWRLGEEMPDGNRRYYGDSIPPWGSWGDPRCSTQTPGLCWGPGPQSLPVEAKAEMEAARGRTPCLERRADKGPAPEEAGTQAPAG